MRDVICPVGTVDEQRLSIEVFLSEKGICLSVPRGCGLEQADSLRVNVGERSIVAIKAGTELPIDCPALSEAHCQALVNAGEVAIGEFVALGVVAAYCLAVVAD